MTPIAYLTTKEAAEYLRISKQTLSNWRFRGEGPDYIKVGGRVVYASEDVSAWLDEHKYTSTSDPGPNGSAA